MGAYNMYIRCIVWCMSCIWVYTCVNRCIQNVYRCVQGLYLTIVPLALMASESIAHEAEGRMGY